MSIEEEKYKEELKAAGVNAEDVSEDKRRI